MPRGAYISQGRTAEVYAWDEKTVVKLFLERIPGPWIDRERSIGRFVWEAALPVPALQGTVREDNRTGLLWERLDGQSMLHTLVHRPLRLRSLALAKAEIHNLIHSVRAPEFPQVRGWLQETLARSPFLSEVQKHILIGDVRHLPEGDVLLHMDFHPGNLLAHDSGFKVIDWLLALRGPPAADIARTLLLLEHNLTPGRMNRFKAWVVQRLIAEFRLAYRTEILRLSGLTAADLAPWMLPLAAARLAEPITHAERLSLLNFLRTNLDPA